MRKLAERLVFLFWGTVFALDSLQNIHHDPNTHSPYNVESNQIYAMRHIDATVGV